jgi:hypothetical protein
VFHARASGFECGVASDALAVQSDFSEIGEAGFQTESKNFLEKSPNTLRLSLPSR